MSPRVAVVGAGAAGLMTAWLLQEHCAVTVLEASDRPGGHSHTVTVDLDGRPVTAELGAEFFFREGYDGLFAMLDRLGMVAEPRAMSISIDFVDEGRTIQLPPRGPAGAMALTAPAVLRRLYWMRALAVAAEQVAAAHDWTPTVADLIAQARLPADVAHEFALPLVASSWGVDRAQAAELAAYSVVRVMGLRLKHRPHNHFLPGGLATYTDALAGSLPAGSLALSSPVIGVRRQPDGLHLAGLSPERSGPYDAVVLACDWHNSARLCADDPHLAGWHHAFSAFEDYSARLALHRDPTFMPANRALWGIANFRFPRDGRPRNTMWSGIREGVDLFRTWLRPDEPAPPGTLREAEYRHIVISPAHHRRQRTLSALQGVHGLHAAGMYTDGIDNHESALRSALRVAERLAPEAPRVAWFADRVSA